MSGRVVIVVLDNGASSAQVAQSNTQLVIGCADAGPIATPYASTNPIAISGQFTGGPLVQASAMIAAVGAVPICVRAATNTAGSQTAVIHTGVGLSVCTVTGPANDTYYVLVKVALPGTGLEQGTIGNAGDGLAIYISLDAGRSFSPAVPLGAATTYVIAGTGLTLNFTVSTFVHNDTYSFGTTAPAWNVAGIQAALNGFAASSYAQQGVGSIHIVGTAAGSDMVAIGGYLQTLKNKNFIFGRAYLDARDAIPPVGYGAGETEATWMAAILSDFKGQALNTDTTGRTAVCAAYYNMTSQIATALGVSPLYRRPLSWAVAQRDTLIPPQRMPSRVKDGALSPIVVTPADASDGFIYHNESVTPGLDTTKGGSGGWFTTATTVQGQKGIFCQHANLFSPVGSTYGYMPQGHVIDIACSVAFQKGTLEIDDDVRVTASGGMDPRDAATIAGAMRKAIKSNMTDAGMLVASAVHPDGCEVVIDTNANIGIGGPGDLPISVQVFGKGFILSETITVGYGT